MTPTQNKTAVVAVGGNALILDKAHEDVELAGVGR